MVYIKDKLSSIYKKNVFNAILSLIHGWESESDPDFFPKTNLPETHHHHYRQRR